MQEWQRLVEQSQREMSKATSALTDQLWLFVALDFVRFLLVLLLAAYLVRAVVRWFNSRAALNERALLDPVKEVPTTDQLRAQLEQRLSTFR